MVVFDSTHLATGSFLTTHFLSSLTHISTANIDFFYFFGYFSLINIISNYSKYFIKNIEHINLKSLAM